MTSPTSPTSINNAPTKTIHAGGITFAYREVGPYSGPNTDIPVVFFTHLAANLDNWDPRIVDAIAEQRHVIVFDQAGVGASTGTTARTIEQAARDAYVFINALGFDKIDAFALSMGGMIVQDLILEHPDLVRKLILIGTGPRGGAGISNIIPVTLRDMLQAAVTRSDPKEYLFFNRKIFDKNEERKAAAKDFIRRINERRHDRDQPTSLSAFVTQLKAVRDFGRSAPSDLSAITQPTLIVNGDNDRMVPTPLSHDMHRRIKDSQLIIYPNAGHGSIFQNYEEFPAVALSFLNS